MPTATSGSTVTHTPATSHCRPVALNDGREELRPGAQPDGREEQRDAELAEREVRVHRHVPDQPPDAPDAAEQQRHDERPAGEAEPHRLRKAGEGDRHRAERNAERDADEERNEVSFVEFLQRVADGVAPPCRGRRGADDLEHVAELQPQPRHGGHLDVRARHPGHRDAKPLRRGSSSSTVLPSTSRSVTTTRRNVTLPVGSDEIFIAALADHPLELIEPARVPTAASWSSR